MINPVVVVCPNCQHPTRLLPGQDAECFLCRGWHFTCRPTPQGIEVALRPGTMPPPPPPPPPAKKAAQIALLAMRVQNLETDLRQLRARLTFAAEDR